MKEKEYRAAEGLSGSQLGLLYSCPSKFDYARKNPKEATPAMLFGTLSHTAVLEPELLSTSYAVQLVDVDYRRSSKIGKANVEALESRGLPVIKYEDYQSTLAMSVAVRANAEAAKIFRAKGENEKPLFWEESGVKCKGRLDRYLSELNVIVDYKTSNDVSLDKFYWKVKDFGYLLQLAHYQAGIKATTGAEAYPGVLIVAQESEAPYPVVVYEIPQELIDEAHAKRRELLREYTGYVVSGVWPSYDKGQGIVRLER
tara:strand:+ start:681 stop:1451 length:771 start_codon:yes stop_codon:yes gene_type:complete